jgi:signal transduction histidine kinase
MHSRARTLLTGFDNARIRNKVLAGFAAVVLPLFALGVATLVSTGTVRSDFDTFARRELPQDTAIDAVEVGTLRLLAAFNHFVSITLASRYADNIALIPGGFADIGGTRNEIMVSSERLRKAIDALSALPVDGEPEEAELRGQIQHVALGVVTQIETAVSEFGVASTDQILDRTRVVRQKAANLTVWIDELHDDGEEQVADAETALTATIDTLQAVAVGGMVLAVVVALFAGLAIAGRIARPIQALRHAAIKLGDGDFTVLENEDRTSDEIGDLVAAFQETTRKLRDSQDKLARNERLSALGQIAGSVSHELRNPLGTIRNSMGMVRQLTANKGLGVERALDRIERSVQRCDVIVGDILEFSRVQELKREETSVDTWLTEMLDEHDVPSAVSVRRELAADAMVMLDRTRFRQVLVNLIDNAAQAMLDADWAASAGRPATMIVRSEAAGPHVRVSVIDNGPGIAADTLERIFEPLFTTKVKGVGLGLPTVRKLVEQHGGTIDVESTVGEGTTFTVWLPRQPGQIHSEPAANLAATA